MPRYDVACTSCGNHCNIRKTYAEYDEDHVFGDGLIGPCRLCDQTVIFRILPGQMLDFHLKGEGFYATDNRDEITNYQLKHF